MSLVVQAIPFRALLVDTVGPINIDTLRAYKAAGAQGVIAYLGGNLTAAAIQAARDEGMGFEPVNFSRKEGWIPTAEAGDADGRLTALHLQQLGVPMHGLSDWCDVEGCGADPTAYCKAWCLSSVASGSGLTPGEYEGAGAILNGHQHYLLPFKGYWHSCSRAIPEPDCGFQMFQGYPPNQPVIGAAPVDWNFVVRDFFGRAPTWLIEAP